MLKASVKTQTPRKKKEKAKKKSNSSLTILHYYCCTGFSTRSAPMAVPDPRRRVVLLEQRR